MGKSKDLATGASYQDQAESDARYANISGDTFTGNVVASTSLQVGDSSITNQYGPSIGYVADFQASSGSQTYISIAVPSASTLGDTGVTIGEDTSDTYITQRGNKPIKIATQDLNRLIIDGSGRVTMPYQPAFAVRNSETGNAYGGGDLANYGTLQINRGGHFNTSNGRFTAPVGGVYCFSWWAQEETFYGNWGGSINAGFYVNGSERVSFGQGSIADPASETWFHMTALIDLNLNDYVTVRFSCSDSTPSFENQQGQFSGYLLG